MRARLPLLPLLPLLISLALIALPTALALAGRHHGGRAPAHMLVYAQEWSLYSSRGSVPHGTVSVQLWNRGQDAHDLHVRPVRHGVMYGRSQAVGVTQSGALRSATWHLGRGTYELYCSMPNHLAKGMHSTITVR